MKDVLTYIIAHPDVIYGWAVFILGAITSSGFLKGKTQERIDKLYHEAVAFAAQWEKTAGKANLVPAPDEVLQTAVRYLSSRLPANAAVDMQKIEAVVANRNLLRDISKAQFPKDYIAAFLKAVSEKGLHGVQFPKDVIPDSGDSTGGVIFADAGKYLGSETKE